ncbi:hypothetical protein KSP40_PGU011631 [Platanthera guangdongensis]|uniref:Uncharacterized protein n=1 Tax=Platanthera guangdongensis TaxID=2320717 RepID=A0ABR2MT55_9ASPA
MDAAVCAPALSDYTSMSQQMLPLIGDEYTMLASDLSGSSNAYGPESTSPMIKPRPQSHFRLPLHCPVSCRSTSSSPPAIRLNSGDWKHVKDQNFSGFVRKALDSCLDYDSLSFPIPGSTIEEEELTFCLKETLVGIFPRSCESSVLRLMAEAQSRHAIFHENIVVKTFYEAEKAHEGHVSKLGQLSKLARDNNTASKTIKADRLHTMFLVMTDARVVLMKLADRIHNMMTVG